MTWYRLPKSGKLMWVNGEISALTPYEGETPPQPVETPIETPKVHVGHAKPRPEHPGPDDPPRGIVDPAKRPDKKPSLPFTPPKPDGTGKPVSPSTPPKPDGTGKP